MTGRLQTVTVSKGALEQEVEERKRAEISLRESEERWSTTLASIGDAVMATDVDGQITFINSIAEALTGWTQAEAVGKPAAEVFNIINEQTRERVANPVGKVLQDKKTQGLANHTVLIRKDGTEVPIDDSAAPINEPAAGSPASCLFSATFRSARRRRPLGKRSQSNASSRSMSDSAWWH